MTTSARERTRRMRHEGAAHWRVTRLRIRRKYHHGNQRGMADNGTDFDEHGRKRDGPTGRQLGEVLDRNGGKTCFGREAVEDEAARSDKNTTDDHGRGNAD